MDKTKSAAEIIFNSRSFQRIYLGDTGIFLGDRRATWMYYVRNIRNFTYLVDVVHQNLAAIDSSKCTT